MTEATQAAPVSPEDVISWDTETYRISAQNLAPPLVCLQFSCEGASGVISTGDPGLDEIICDLFTEQHHMVGANISYDLAVVAARLPQLFPAIFEALEEGRVHDIQIREKLLNLTTHGKLTMVEIGHGAFSKIEYSQGALEKQYLGIDRSAMKSNVDKSGTITEGDSDAWRLNYDVLDGIPSDQWPEEARTYAIDDAVHCETIYHIQEKRRHELFAEIERDPFITESFQVASAFALHLMSAWGMAVDPVEKERVEKLLAEELDSDKLRGLIDAGILHPGSPEEPYANGAKAHLPDCPNKGKGQGCDCPPKMKKGRKPSISQTKLRAYVEALAKRLPDDVELKYTDASEKFPEGQISTDSEWLEDHWHLDPILEEYRHRQQLQKLVTTELPRMNWIDENGVSRTAPVVHPCYDVLKETGRTSSFASKTYPSFNCQNVSGDITSGDGEDAAVFRIRNCFVPRPGYLLASTDYSALELCSTAQTCLWLFGQSKLAELINAGNDPHEYLGAQIAYASHDDFRDSCNESGAVSKEDIHKAFHECKGSDVEEVRSFWKHYRKLAKPTGLGYPGGLGPKTFQKYAKGTYGVVIDFATATQLRDLWRATFPEMPVYHEWINSQIDTRNGPKIRKDKKTGEEKQSNVYWYDSPMGMHRAGCDYCSAANGKCMQTPSAEGAKLAVFNCVRATYDPTMNSILYPDAGGVTTRFMGFIHDELLYEVREDAMAHERVLEVQRIMQEAMTSILPDIKIKTASALMRRWDKNAEAVFDDTGRLIPWEPKNA